jgi:hypothetical protein
MKITKIKKTAQENQENQENIDSKTNYTVRNMLSDLFKWENFLGIVRNNSNKK